MTRIRKLTATKPNADVDEMALLLPEEEHDEQLEQFVHQVAEEESARRKARTEVQPRSRREPYGFD